MTDTSPSIGGAGVRRVNLRDALAGLLFIAMGAAIASIARSYTIGTPSDSGPGFFPFYLGMILAGLGAIIACLALLDRGGNADSMAVRPRGFLGVLGPVVLFGILLMPVGLVISTFFTVLLSSLASREFRWRGALANAVILCVIVLVGFALILGIQIPVWPRRLMGWLS